MAIRITIVEVDCRDKRIFKQDSRNFILKCVRGDLVGDWKDLLYRYVEKISLVI